MNKNKISYQRIKPLLSDLDLIFFKGSDFVSKTIMGIEREWLGVGDWSHVGMVISKKTLTNIKTPDSYPMDTLYIWESTLSSSNKLLSADPTLDIESGKGVFGVQIRVLDDVINSTINKENAICGWAKLINNPLNKKEDESFENYIERKNKITSILNKLHEKYYHRPYPLDILRIARSVFTCCTCIKPLSTKHSVFCSQFVTIIYEHLDLIKKNIISGDVAPEDLADPQLEEIHFDRVTDIVSSPVAISKFN